jgi:hypothetical protein
MSDVDGVLKSELSSLGVKVYALKRPVDSPLPCLVYRRVSELDYMVHSGAIGLAKNRFTIIHVASSYAGLRTLVDSVRTKLIGSNNANFNAVSPSEVDFENEEAPNIYTATKDFFIWL